MATQYDGIVYVDGSYIEKKKIGSYAAILLGNHQEKLAEVGEWSNEIKHSYEPEYLAVLLGVKTAIQFGKKAIVLIYDFELIDPELTIKAKNTHHAQYRQKYIEQLNQLKKHSQLTIVFKNVKAHATLVKGGDKLNRQVDQLAKAYAKLAIDEGEKLLMYLAIKKPTELQGVYSGAAKDEMQKQIAKKQGVSYRSFVASEKTAALKWATVNTVTTTLKNKQAVKVVAKVKKKEPACQTKECSSFEMIMQHYRENKENELVIVTLMNSQELCIQLQDYYYNNSSHCNFYMYSNALNMDAVEKYVSVMKASTVTYYREGFLLENYDLHLPKETRIPYGGKHTHESEIYVPFSAVLSVKPGSFPKKFSAQITDKKIITAYKTLQKQP
ncbi:MAG: RNase H family protein [Culicoidibacterales bacterium]